ncbi:MAG: hypothetical protein U0174_12850 [Polyangiaceae bacterium]
MQRLQLLYAKEVLAYTAWHTETEEIRTARLTLAWTGAVVGGVVGGPLLLVGLGFTGSVDADKRDGGVGLALTGGVLLGVGALLATVGFLTVPDAGPETYERAKIEDEKANDKKKASGSSASRTPPRSPAFDAGMSRVSRGTWSPLAPFSLRF